MVEYTKHCREDQSRDDDKGCKSQDEKRRNVCKVLESTRASTVDCEMEQDLAESLGVVCTESKLLHRYVQ